MYIDDAFLSWDGLSIAPSVDCVSGYRKFLSDIHFIPIFILETSLSLWQVALGCTSMILSYQKSRETAFSTCYKYSNFNIIDQLLLISNIP